MALCDVQGPPPCFSDPGSQQDTRRGRDSARLDRLAGSLDKCDCRHRLDRLFILSHRAGRRSSAQLASGQACGRCMAAVSTRSRNFVSRRSSCPPTCPVNRRWLHRPGYLRRGQAERRSELRCRPAAKPQFPSFAEAPKGVLLDTPAQIPKLSPRIMAQAVKTNTMPIGNVTQVTETERPIIGTWIRGGTKCN